MRRSWRRRRPPDRDAAACTDFYAHANDSWIAATPIPADASSINIFTGVAARNLKALLAELDRLAGGNGTTRTPDQQALVDLHASRADVAAIESAGLAPLAEDLALIDRMVDVSRLPSTWGLLVRHGVRLPVSLKFKSFDDPELLSLQIHTDRLKVVVEPEAPFEVALETSTGDADALLRFEAHIARTLVLTGMSATEATDVGRQVAAIKRALASQADVATGARADPDTTAPRFAMSDLLAAAGMPGALPHHVDDSTLHILGRLQATHDARAWRGFTRWRLARSFTDHLPARFAVERTRWDAPKSEGIENGEPVDARLAFLARTLPRQLDLFFTGRILPSDTSAHVRDVADGVRAALHRRLDDRGWLNAASRAASHRLVDTVELVYPALDEGPEAATAASPEVPAMRRDALLDNVRRAAAYDLDRRFGLALTSRTARHFDGDAWSNFEARYNSISHRVVVGPATLQAMLANADSPADRYGRLGAMMAHELLHMFEAPTDRRFSPWLPADVGWLDASDQPYFNAMVARLQQDYAGWTLGRYALGAPKVRFMGEDLSDLGSVPVALAALRHASGRNAVDEDAFYRAFASMTRTRQSVAQDRAFIGDSPGHALYSYRINGPLSNLPSFSRHYGCVAGDAMVRTPEARVELW
ncbi:MAG TPA: M13-type metalloendopeptidase [Variovorax sp.]|nr:M13-type metalloendopeptidase [Variovorax sp.]